MMTTLKNNFITVKLTGDIQKSISPFDCGNPALTAFLRSYDALDDMFGKTYVMLENEKTVIGYYNISTGCIEDNNRIRIGGAVYINCLAVDKDYQRKKLNGIHYYSDILLADCLNRIEDIRNNSLGFAFVTLSSTDEGYYLYERNGFSVIEDDMNLAKNDGELSCVPMYLPIDYE